MFTTAAAATVACVHVRRHPAVSRLGGGMLIARRIRKATAADRAGVLLLLKVRVLGRRAAVQVHAGSSQHLLLLRRRGHTRRTALLLLSGHSVRAQGRVRVAVIASTAATARRSHSSSSLLVLAHGLLLLHAAAPPSPEGRRPHAVLAHATHLLLVLRLHSPHPASSVGLLLAQHRCAHHPAGGASSHRRRGAVVRLLRLLVQRVLAMPAPHVLVVLMLVVHVRGSVATVLLARRRIAAHHALVLHFQPLAADLEAVHGLDRRVCVLQCVVRNESKAFGVGSLLVHKHLRRNDVAEGSKQRGQVRIRQIARQMVDEKVSTRGAFRRADVRGLTVQRVLLLLLWDLRRRQDLQASGGRRTTAVVTCVL
mmetsp:Transcript_12704/g.22234  ORF Transcript_12704/g.22234 Transcript_12704/m.22234 type:complete len:367 (+) Transcript_12704:363-1463(+)